MLAENKPQPEILKRFLSGAEFSYQVSPRGNATGGIYKFRENETLGVIECKNGRGFWELIELRADAFVISVNGLRRAHKEVIHFVSLCFDKP